MSRLRLCLLFCLFLLSGSGCTSKNVYAAQPPGDYGVILYLSGTPGCTYVNPAGQTVSCESLLSTYKASSSQVVGQFGSAAFDIHCLFTGTTSMTVKAEVKRYDPSNNFWDWEPLITVLSNNTGTPVTAFEQVLTPSAGNEFRLLTGDSRLSGYLRISAKSASVTSATGIAIGLSAGGAL